MIGDNLPAQSRTALAVTSRSMFSRLGGVAPGSGNHSHDAIETEITRDPPPPPTPKMEFLELLERDSPGLVRCGYCRTLHSPTTPGPDGPGTRRCEAGGRALLLKGINRRITQPLVRAAVQRSRAGFDPGVLLGRLNRHVRKRLPHSPYTALVDYEARVVDGSVMLRKQVFVARDGPYTGPGGSPTSAELCTLAGALRKMQGAGDPPDKLWWGLCAIPVRQCVVDAFGPAAIRAESDGEDDRPAAKRPAVCTHARLDVGPPRRPLPTWEYFFRPLFDERSNKCCTRWAPVLGHVQAIHEEFLDYSMTAHPAPEEVGGRTLVFTWWRNLGDGSSPDEARWRARPGATSGWDGNADPWFRLSHGSTPADVTKGFEGLDHGGWYVTRMRRSQAEMLHSPWSHVPDETRKKYLEGCKPG